MQSSRLILVGALGVVLYATSSCGVSKNEDPSLTYNQATGGTPGTGNSTGTGGNSAGGIANSPSAGGSISVGGTDMPTVEECTPPMGPVCRGGDPLRQHAKQVRDAGVAGGFWPS